MHEACKTQRTEEEGGNEGHDATSFVTRTEAKSVVNTGGGAFANPSYEITTTFNLIVKNCHSFFSVFVAFPEILK